MPLLLLHLLVPLGRRPDTMAPDTLDTCPLGSPYTILANMICRISACTGCMHDWRRLAANCCTHCILPHGLSCLTLILLLLLMVMWMVLILKFNFYGFILKISLNPSLLML